ncbi:MULTISPECIES: adenosylcobinamide-GDP ribazoletransferase [unclassified Chelatococcus]|uniref:adenosylcobinamide-GDP ribazoletransferase n=1 Tax=unclassified Chelatococcus TaxID=2638111 RepID=UPI001BCE7656|nr:MULTISPECIES: adenosylcobinamide-GDP ribazoletransferase [unclassified Chelatococcus]MBS7739260.1 adenosylcobinamide-GDP ribazoletransferase [Chelatococcus sp. HY11]MBX3546539.1 adenosylcobinamide-GDP ribazoletransferase [Chelatococcus sp.]MCO5076207.1 adenosylcobinamide-GDP ribazoletransferase [Chelatococcus sp.]
MTGLNDDRDARRVGGSAGWRGLVADTAACLVFYSRLPVPQRFLPDGGKAAPDFGTMIRALPLAGAIIGLGGGLAMAAGLSLGFGALPSAVLAVAALTMITGALHEDGWADTADGLFGGRTRERRLEIMRDSRIGAFGAAALCLGLLLRVALLAELASRAPALSVAAAVVVAAAISRTAGLLPLATLPPAKPDGAGASAGRPDATALSIAALLCLMLIIAAGFGADVGIGSATFGALLALAAAWGTARLARAKLGGHTGDIAGAAQQAAEMAFFLGMLAMTT